jgi:iron only hydrogenase large subunit-like protein
MNKISPLYTQKTKCRDCFKCIRHCPVKAIRVENGSAVVDSTRCILCGKCSQVCPVEAKRIRNDIERVRLLFKSGRRVIASLAPSYKSAYNVSDSAIILALKRLGFTLVSETALGATAVSKRIADELEYSDRRLVISSACPVINEYICKYRPEYADSITGLLSPALAHGKYLKEYYGSDTAVVFINPCVAKKKESDSHTNFIDVSLSFLELEKMFSEDKILLTEPEKTERFEPVEAGISSIFPIDGGMIETIKSFYKGSDYQFVSFTGIDEMDKVLGDDSMYHGKKLFLELMACSGGCINGPVMRGERPVSLRKLDITLNPQSTNSEIKILENTEIAGDYPIIDIQQAIYSEHEINEVLRQVGKCSHKDELNCGGCGYSTCRDFASAVLSGFAQTYMCVTYMRSIAMNKANALLKAMPSGVIIVDDKLKVIECNRKFAEIIGGDLTFIYDAKPGLTDSYLTKIISFSSYFSAFFKSSVEIMETEITFNKKILRLIIFPIEDRRIIGGIVQDITHPSMHRDQIISKAKKVIMTNLTAVQQIAFLLGESASETEILLNSVINSFENDKND